MHTVLPKNATKIVSQSPQRTATNSTDENPETNTTPSGKRSHSDSTVSETGGEPDSDPETHAKRIKTDSVDEVSNQPSPESSGIKSYDAAMNEIS